MKEISLRINGMECNGCENRVKNALESVEGVKKVIASHTTGLVNITVEEDVEVSLLEEVIESLDYEIIKEDK